MLIACSTSIPTCEIALPNSTLEQLWIKTLLPGVSVYISVVYIPPSHANDSAVLNALYDSVRDTSNRIKESDLLYVIGSFNKHDIRWELTNTSDTEDSSPCFTFSHYAAICNSVANTDFINGMNSNRLFQLNGIVNQFGRQLDLVFANLAAVNILCDSITALQNPANGTPSLGNSFPYVSHCCNPLLSEDSHHPSLDIVIRFPTQFSRSTNNQSRRSRNFFKTDVERMNSLIASFYLDFDCSNFTTIDEATESFSAFMRSAINSCVPVAHPKPGPDWSNASLRRLIKIKSKAYDDYHRTRSALHRRIFFDALNNYRRQNRVLYRSYIRRSERQTFYETDAVLDLLEQTKQHRWYSFIPEIQYSYSN